MENNNYRLAVIGTESTVLLYQSIGCEVRPVYSCEEAQKQLQEILNAKEEATPYAIVFVEEVFFQDFPEDLIEKLTHRSLPAVVPIPSPGSSKDNYALSRLSRIVEKAVGTNILT